MSIDRPRAGIALALAAAGCGAQPGVERGAELFSSPALSGAAENRYSCATCHEAAAGGAARVLPGYPMAGVSARPAFWGGAYPTLREAVDECRRVYQRAAGPLPADDTDGRALLAYLQSLGAAAGAPPGVLPLTVEKNVGAACAGAGACPAGEVCNRVAPADPQHPAPWGAPCAPGGGDCYCDAAAGSAESGRDLYDRGCRACHGATHTGEGRLAPDEPLLPEDAVRRHGLDPRTGARAFALEKIRHGGFFGVGGRMPLYSVEALSAAQVADLLAFLGR